MPATVSCRACASYDPDLVRAAVDACFADLGGLGAFVRQGDRVFLKPNLLMPARPAQAITTHPQILRAVIRAVKAVGGEPVVGDSPAATPLRVTARRAGLLEVVEQEDVPLADMATATVVRSDRVAGGRSFEVAQAALDCDVVINLPKLKTHGLTYITIAQKNLFGLVPGLRKGRWHMVAQAPEHFAGLLADLYASILDHPGGPRHFLHLVDGVVGLEGDGPGTGGSPRQLGLMLASTDAVAVDRVACELVGLDPALAPLLRISGERGLGQAQLEHIQLVGDPLDQLQGEPMRAPAGRSASPTMQAALWSSARLRNLALERPLVHRQPCVACGQCAHICPAEAIRMDDHAQAARVDYTRCIRCYCCAEICPHAAISKSDVPPLGRLLVDGSAPRWGMLALVALPLLLALALGMSMVLGQPGQHGPPSPNGPGHPAAQGPPPGAAPGQGQPPPPGAGAEPKGPPPGQDAPGPDGAQAARAATAQPAGKARDSHALPLGRTEAELLAYAASGDPQRLGRASASAQGVVRPGEQHDYPRFLLALVRTLQGQPDQAQALLEQTDPLRRHFWARFFADGLEPALPYLAANLAIACETNPQALGEHCAGLEPSEPPADYQAFRQASWIHHSRDRLGSWGPATSGMSPAEFFAALGIQPGMDVVDVGAGDGWFTVPMARHLDTGSLWAAELDPGLVDYLGFAARYHQLDNLRVVLTRPDDLGLEDASLDAAFACDVLSQVYASHAATQNPQLIPSFLASIARALRPGGLLVVIDQAESARQPQALPSAKLIQDLQAVGMSTTDSPLVLGAGVQLLLFRKPSEGL